MIQRIRLTTLLFSLVFFFGLSAGSMAQALLLRLRTQEEKIVVNVVEKAKEAVVSVVGSKEVDVFDTVQDQIPIGQGSNLFVIIDRLKKVGREEQPIVGGTGFFVTRDGYVVTSNHVIEDTSAHYKVVMNNGDILNATIVYRDLDWDIALLKVEGNNFPVIRFSNSDQIALGQTVIAIGNSLAEFSNTISKGIVSGMGRVVTANTGQTFENVIQTDAAINQGNSGGPLLNTSGELVGINFSTIEGAENLSFSIPSVVVKEILQKFDGNLIKNNRRSSTQ